MVAPASYAATYYVDFDDGDNSNGGTGTSDAWRTLPGTCTNATSTSASCTAVAETGWETINAGDTIYLKSGTTYSTADVSGGRIHLGSPWYATNATPSNQITIQRKTDWGSGSVTFEASGVNLPLHGWGFIEIRRSGGYVIDGVSGVSTDYNGIIIQNSIHSGISTNPGWTVAYEGCTFQYIYFYNNESTHTGSDDQSGGNLFIYHHNSAVVVDHCEFNGNNVRTQGISIADNDDRVTDATISNCLAYDFAGTDNSGIGFKAQNSVVVFDNVVAHDCFKGIDAGEQTAISSWNIDYTVKNSTFYNNNWGTNFSSSQSARTGYFHVTIFNNIYYDNIAAGIDVYSSPWEAYIVHNTLYNNGTEGGNESRQIGLTSDTPYDSLLTRSYVYNNIFYKPGGNRNLSVERWASTTSNQFVMNSNYNSWVKRASEYFCSWMHYGVGDEECNFSYGTNGPGKATGNWYNWYGCHDSASSQGHFQQDANSVGTGATDTTEPPFISGEPAANNIFTLTETYPGKDISAETWYTEAMGTDRNGVTRTFWDMGAYESGEEVAPPNAIQGVTIN